LISVRPEAEEAVVERVSVVGTGTWGTTLAVLVAQKGIPTTLWCRGQAEAEQLRRDNQNRTRLPDIIFPPSLTVTASLPEAASASALLLVVPAQAMRANVRRLREYLPCSALLLSCAKGIELETGMRMTQVISEELPEASARIAVLSGPNLAREIAAGQPATSVVAARDSLVAGTLRTLLMSPRFRVYTNSDVLGVELAGALKNIIAIGAGFCDGLRLGDNAKAAFITRGLIEIARLGMAVGAQPLTFAGLSGLGDVIATCASPFSRNRYVGEQLALGRSLHEIQRAMRMVAEGVPTTKAARLLALRHGVEMPIVEMTHAVLFADKDPLEALVALMTRDPKDEFSGILS
jgi:glycerol-3-phosphate dehydrogenase (NAD(P)+)